VVLTVRRCGLLAVIFGAHYVVFWLISLSDNSRSERRPEETRVTLFFVELPKPGDTQRSTHSSSRRQISTYDPEKAITLSPEIEEAGAIIDWNAEAGRVASDVAGRMGEEKEFRSMDSHPAGMGPPPPKSSGHKSGDSQHFEGGEIIDWTSNRCYYSSQDGPVGAFGQALRLQIPICTGAGGTGEKPLPSLEEWKKERERDNR
jgi:hypothetical protein